MTGTFTWNELATTSVEAAKAFYGATLGWTFEEFELPDGPYCVAHIDGRPIAGIGGLETGALDDDGSYWFSFIEVDALDQRVEQAVELGASIVRPAIDVPGVGRVVVLEDPTGAVVGWIASPGA